MKHLPLLILLVALTLIVAVGVRDSRLPERVAGLQATPLTPVTPTAMPPPGWWEDMAPVMPGLPTLPALPKLALPGAAGGGPGQALPFQILSCPTAGVQISGIVTAQAGWWHILGTASIAELWYWKAEISGDGAVWAGLYQAEQAVTEGVLVRLKLSTIPPGSYQIRLMAVDRTGNYPGPCVVAVER